jgi:hypothetical protein
VTGGGARLAATGGTSGRAPVGGRPLGGGTLGDAQISPTGPVGVSFGQVRAAVNTVGSGHVTDAT